MAEKHLSGVLGLSDWYFLKPGDQLAALSNVSKSFVQEWPDIYLDMLTKMVANGTISAEEAAMRKHVSFMQRHGRHRR